jgi:hypothetical protein
MMAQHGNVLARCHAKCQIHVDLEISHFPCVTPGPGASYSSALPCTVSRKLNKTLPSAIFSLPVPNHQLTTHKRLSFQTFELPLYTHTRSNQSLPFDSSTSNLTSDLISFRETIEHQTFSSRLTQCLPLSATPPSRP